MRNPLRAGFTLLEMLVTLILLGILAAVVFPVVTQQLDDAEPTKAANDLANIRTGLELFHLNVRPDYAGDLEDLANAITTADSDLSASAFGDKDTERWNGPYVDATIPSSAAAGDLVITTGFGGEIVNDLKLFNSDGGASNFGTSDDFGATTANADFVAIQINNLTVAEFEAINDLIDGDETDGAAAGESQVSGKFRYLDPAVAGENDTAFYLAIPYK